ncbi:MAG TPA: TlpA disulfide reductase family protein [Steroidobacteraceae bacterium]|nr:TlpA disulfide reductase family protein [Steroidobacteraceae bacterium]
MQLAQDRRSRAPDGRFGARRWNAGAFRCIVMLCCMMLAVGPASGHTIKVGEVPPDDLGKAAAGDPVHLSSYRGKIVIISFWASWCTPCRKELPVLAGMQQQATRERMVVLAVNWGQNTDQFRQIVKTLSKVDLTLISDESRRLGARYNVKAIPHMVIIGRDGKVAAIHEGYAEEEFPRLADEINALWSRTAPDDGHS